MKLTAKLAYSQLKVNRSRTGWTLAGIIISTALITAVCCFAASGGALASEMAALDPEESGEVFSLLFLIPVIILSAIIVSMSVTVISSTFRISASERTAQFGILKSVGATGQHIFAVMIYESAFLSIVGIPAGIIAGLSLAFAGVKVANHYFDEINSLVHLMINELTIVIDFVVVWQALVAAAAISFITVLFSAWRPAKRAAKITAIESIQKTGEVKLTAKQIRTSDLTKRLFGFEGTLAAGNIKRSKDSFRASIVSLTVGVVLFICLGAVSSQVRTIEEMIYPDIPATVMVDYTSVRDVTVNETTGRDEVKYAKPIDNDVANVVTERLREYADTDIFGVGDDMETYIALIPDQMLSPQFPEAAFFLEERPEYEMSMELITMDAEKYAALCKRAGVPVGSNILINQYSHNDNGRLVEMEPYIFDGKPLRLLKADGSVSEMPVHGEIIREEIPGELLGPGTQMVRLIVPQGKMRNYIWSADPADIEGFIDYANEVMDELFPQAKDSAYMELGFTTRVYKIRDYMKVMNIAIVLVQVFVYSFVALLMLIGFTSVISTMSANVRLRFREFAVLRSVGMTRGGLNRMLTLESLMCSARSLIIGVPLAVILTYLINTAIRSVFPFPYSLPWLPIIYCSIGVFAITWLTMRFAISRMQKENIIDAIR